jgi:hypothetical protein
MNCADERCFSHCFTVVFPAVFASSVSGLVEKGFAGTPLLEHRCWNTLAGTPLTGACFCPALL